MSSKKKAYRFGLILGAALVPIAFLLIWTLNPAFFAAASGWYGYNGLPVVPEATGSGHPYFPLAERNNRIIPPTGDLVRFLDGVLNYRADGISLPAPGYGYTHRPVWNNNHENGTLSSSDSNYDFTSGWNWHAGLPQLVSMGSNSYEIRLVGMGSASTKYIGTSTYNGQLGLDDKIVHNTGAKQMVLYANDGGTCTFNDFDSSHGNKKGACLSIAVAGGTVLTTDFYTHAESTNLEDLVQKLTDSSGHEWVFTYIDNTGSVNNRRIQKVEAKEGSTAWGTAEYKYYDSSSSDFTSGSGSNGDLMKITVTEPDMEGNRTRNTLFRYWTGTWSGSNTGAAHKLKYIVGPQSYAKLEAEYGDPLLASDAQVAQYADYFIRYDSSSRVTEATVHGEGCGCSCGQGTFTYVYASNGSWTTGSDFSVWKLSVTQTNPDGTVRIVDVNKGGAIINDIFQNDSTYTSGGSDQQWITHQNFDSSGRITEVYHPSACTVYDTGTHAATLASSAGLVDVLVYDSNGNLTGRKVKQGSGGTLHWTEKTGYTSQTLSSHTIYLPSSRKSYPSIDTTTDGTSGVETTLAYTYYTSSLQMKELTMTHPAVPTAENGENAADTHKYYFSLMNQLQWEKDEENSITYRTYHADLGLMTSEIGDLDTDGYSPPTGFTNSSGLSISTTYTYDDGGKLLSMTDPEGRIEEYLYTHLDSGQPVNITYPHVDGSGAVGPVSIKIFDFDQRLVTTSRGELTDPDATLTDDFDESQPTLEEAFVGNLSSRSENVYVNGQKTEDRSWTDAGSDAAEKYVTKYGYDSRGRLARVEDAEGTITRTYYTVHGQVRHRDVGTNDHGATNPDGSASGTNNMTTVEAFLYDGEEADASAVGDGNLTEEERPANTSSSRFTAFAYDWRNCQTVVDGEELFYQKRDYDNMGRVTITYRYSDSNSSSNLRSKAETKYDKRGHIWQTVAYEVDPSNGTVDDSLATDSWYDGRGNLLKTRSPSSVFQKILYDSAGRVQKTYVSYDTDETGETVFGEADDVTGDTVIEEKEFSRDKVGNIFLETRWERKSIGTSSGELTTSSAERYYMAFWYDILHRLDTQADYGTNGGTDLTPPGTPPSSSDTVLVTTYEYNGAGLVEDSTNPAGRTNRKEYDKLGRVVRIIKNYVDGTPGSGDDDQKQELAYNRVSKVTSRKTWMTSSSDPEETGYEYGVVKGSRPDSDIASKNLLKKIKYPDPSSGSPSSSADDQETFAYNAQGEVAYRKDQIGNVHEFDFDEIGRRTADKVTTLVSPPTDGSIRRIQATYDALDRVTKVTSYDAATSGNVENEVELAYNGFGQIKESKQEHGMQPHDGAVDGNTLKVVYSWSEAENGDPLSRLSSIQYPATNRTVFFHYDDPSGGTDHAKMDWVLGRMSAVSNNSSISADRVADYLYQGIGRVVTRLNQDPSGTSNDIQVDTSYDQFGRVAQVLADSSATINEFNYGYNRLSQALWREENQSTGKDELYTYDDLARLDVFKRGDLNGGRTDITSPTRTLDWGLDLVGNWSTITDGSTVTRTHNRSNEITDVDGQTGGDPTYDKNGNTTLIHHPLANPLGYVYDAWNRLVAVKFVDTTIQNFQYDGFGRRIYEGTSPVHYYYSESWQLLSERGGSTSTDKTLKEYVWGIQYVDEIVARDEDKNSDGDTRDAADDTIYYIQDANWNVHTLCDESGSPVERNLYDPYGLVTFKTGTWGSRASSAYGNQLLFTGRILNSTSLTYDYRYREYSAYIGRFLQRDPIGIWGDGYNCGNGYGYVAEDPINKFDPEGLSLKVSPNNAQNRQLFQSLIDELCPDRFTVLPNGSVSADDDGFCNDHYEYIAYDICESPYDTDNDGGYYEWRTRGCKLSDTPVGCCCICDAINAWGTYTLTPRPNPGGTSKRGLFLGGTVTVGPARPEGYTGTGDGSPPSPGSVRGDQSILLGHELCGHALGNDAVETENDLRRERNHNNPQNPPLGPRDGLDHG